MNNQSTFSKIINWMTSAAGLTIIISMIVAIVATIDSGPFTLINAIVTGGMWALMSAGLSLLFGVMNLVNFAHGEFFMIGTLVAYFTFTPLNDYLKDNPSTLLMIFAPIIAILAATLVGLVFGAIMEKLVFLQLRKRSKEQWVMNTFLLTVGLSVIIINGTQLIWGTDFKGITRYWDVEPLHLWGINISVDRAGCLLYRTHYYGCFLVLLTSNKSGHAIRAVSMDETGALMVGINLNRIQVLTVMLSSALAAMAGASLLFMFPSYPTVGLKPLYIAWYVVIIAGLGNVSGAIVGGFIVALLQTLTSFYIGVGWEDVIPTAIIMLILLIKPSGLFGSEVKGVHEQ